VTRALGTLTRKGEMVEFDPEKIKAEAVYKLLIGCVVPRPIYSHIHGIFAMKRPVDDYRG
jgi:hypothetical protein